MSCSTIICNSAHIIDIIIVVVYLALCVLIALYQFKSIKTLKEYTLGKASLPNIVIITTLFATYIGAGSVMGGIEKVYTLGMFFVVAHLLSPLLWLIMAKIYGENIEQFRGCLSSGDIMTLLYGKIGRWVTNIASTLMSVGIVAMQAVAMGNITNYCFGIAYHHGVIITCLILALYSSLGGIRAIAFIDVFQLTVIIVALPIAFSFVYTDLGGYSGIVNSLPDNMLTLDINTDNVFLFLSMTLYSILPVSTSVFIQRFLMCRDSVQLTHCLNAVAVISFFFAIIICMIGLILKIKEPYMDPNIVLIHYIMDHIAIGFKGIIMAGLLAVMMSTADSWFNTGSVLLTHDIISKIIPLNGKQALLVARILTFLLSIFSIFVALSQKEVVKMYWITVNIWVPLLFIPLSAGFLKFRTKSESFISSIILAIFFTATSAYIMEDLGSISLMCGMIGSAIGLFGTHYWRNFDTVLKVKQ